MTTGDVWELLGDLAEDDAVHVLTRLFAMYEKRQQINPDDEAAELFFIHMAAAIEQAGECNLNRR